MRNLRYLRLYLALGGCLIGYVAFACLDPASWNASLSGAVDNAWHLIAFGLTMGWFGQLVLDRRIKANLALALIGLGAGLMVIRRWLGPGQAMDGRAFLAEILGVWLGHWATRQGGGALLATVERHLVTRS